MNSFLFLCGNYAEGLFRYDSRQDLIAHQFLVYSRLIETSELEFIEMLVDTQNPLLESAVFYISTQDRIVIWILSRGFLVDLDTR